MNEQETIESFVGNILQQFSIKKISFELFKTTNTYFVEIIPRSTITISTFELIAMEFIEKWEALFESSISFISENSLTKLSSNAVIVYNEISLFNYTMRGIRALPDNPALVNISWKDLNKINKPFGSFATEVFVSIIPSASNGVFVNPHSPLDPLFGSTYNNDYFNIANCLINEDTTIYGSVVSNRKQLKYNLDNLFIDSADSPDITPTFSYAKAS
ncbi:MAG: hypothetical protein WDA22_01675 [Bacteroidota bacterium]